MGKKSFFLDVNFYCQRVKIVSYITEGLFARKALFTRNVCIYVFVKCQEWVLWQQVMVFTLNICVFKN